MPTKHAKEHEILFKNLSFFSFFSRVSWAINDMKNSILLLFFCAIFFLNAAAQRKTENVILITLDGARTQEIFGGLDRELYKKIDKNAETKEVYQLYAAETATERREKLLPFFWQTWMKNHGSIAGNRELKSEL